MKKVVLLAFVLVLLSTAVVVGSTRPAVAEETIYIRANGSVEGHQKAKRLQTPSLNRPFFYYLSFKSR